MAKEKSEMEQHSDPRDKVLWAIIRMLSRKLKEANFLLCSGGEEGNRRLDRRIE